MNSLLCLLLMIPFQKIFTLLIRTFSKPMLGYLKQRQQENKMMLLRWVFVRVGRQYHSFEHWLNHRILKTSHKKQITELKEEVLLEKGIQAVYEMLFYAIVIGFPLYELYTGAVSSQRKEKELQENINKLQVDLTSLNATLQHTLTVVRERNREAEILERERDEKVGAISREREERRHIRDKEYYQQRQEDEKKELSRLLSEEVLANEERKDGIQEIDEKESAADASREEGS